MYWTMDRIEAHYSTEWNTAAAVVPYRTAGNRTAYAVTDHGDNWLPLLHKWTRNGQRFTPHPDPAWLRAVGEATRRAADHFAHVPAIVARADHPGALSRLERAHRLALGRIWEELDDEANTWLFPGSTNPDRTYEVNGSCTCPDACRRGGNWCKHRLARALTMRARLILAQEQDPDPDPGSDPAPAEEEIPVDLDLVSAIRPVWGNPHATQIHLRDQKSGRQVIDVPHTKVEEIVRRRGWKEGSTGSGYWMNPHAIPTKEEIAAKWAAFEAAHPRWYPAQPQPAVKEAA